MSINCLIRGFVSAMLIFGGVLIASAETAEYRVTFTATWSAETHPIEFPNNPHFSPLIGGTHDGSIAFWEEGELASIGIQRMAEWGSQNPLDDEVEAAIDESQAEFVLRDDAVPGSPGFADLEFVVSEEFSLVTLVTMVAPSPDWFLGVSGQELRPDGQWVEFLTVTLWPYDAGTDSGASYSSSNQPTNPHVPVSLITEGPLANGVPLGTFVFERIDLTSNVPNVPDLTLFVAPNPFNPATSVHFTLPTEAQTRLDIHAIDGSRITTLIDGSFQAGSHEISWNGRDHRGVRVASGTYLARLVSGRVQQSIKLVLVE
ncbi:MAG: hypothetical protein GY780_01350 [bacterium]|nr:hypothetical protein [bacterium]